jgi:hypothetical protein
LKLADAGEKASGAIKSLSQALRRRGLYVR